MYHQCDDAGDFHKRRASTRALLMDYGTEAEMHEMSIDILQRCANKYSVKEPERYFFPWALGLIDKLHQLYGALDKCCKRSKLYKNFIDILIILQAFYCDKGLLRRLRQRDSRTAKTMYRCSATYPRSTLTGVGNHCARRWT